MQIPPCTVLDVRMNLFHVLANSVMAIAAMSSVSSPASAVVEVSSWLLLVGSVPCDDSARDGMDTISS